jgi:2'-5' RNA ligase
MLIRAFFAIDLPFATKNAIQMIISDLQKKPELKQIRWIKPQNLHITLQFMPEFKTGHTPKLIEHVQQELSVIKAFDLSIGAMEIFPSLKKPRFLSLAAHESAELSQLSSAIGRGMVSTGYAIDKRLFRAHITLGGIIPGHPPIEHPLLPANTIESIRINEVILFRSQPTAKGSLYTPIEKLFLL